MFFAKKKWDFDSLFFGISSQKTEQIDPQQHIVVKIA